MARIFNDTNIPAKAIWADTPAGEREAALRDLAERRVNVVFSVDIFNEGVDVPTVDTLMLLRPTDSPVLFLQQLGRGLRRSPGKRFCTVLDFVGLHRQEFRFDRRFAALLGGTRSDLTKQIEAGFPFLPAGCHLEFDRVATERVLGNIRNAVPSQWSRKVAELQALSARHGDVALADYLAHTGSVLEDVYNGDHCWSDMRAAAGLSVRASGPAERELRKAIGRLLHVDDGPRIEGYRETLFAQDPLSAGIVTSRYARMLVASLVGTTVERQMSLGEAVQFVRLHPQVIAETLELLALLPARIQHLGAALQNHPAVPLRVHARYTRIEIQAAFGDGSSARVPVWREGVKYIAHEKSDVFVFTLDKTSGGFSPTTRYRDYAISRDLVHWESQSTTRSEGPTGRRYQTHAGAGSSIMLFARLRDSERAFYFLGPADYVSHEGEMPMAITWRLKYPLPGDLFAAFAAAVA